MNAQLASPSAEKISAGADVVAEVEQLIEFKSLFADRVFLHINLEPLAVLLQMREPRLAHEANGHDPSSYADVRSRGFELFAGLVRIFGQNLRQGVGKIVFCGICLLAESLNLLEFLQPHFVDIVVECQEWAFARESKLRL